MRQHISELYPQVEQLQQAVEQAVPDAVALVKGAGVVSEDGTVIPAPTTSELATQFIAQRIAITGQTTAPPAMGWRMSNNNTAKRLDAIEKLRDERGVVVAQQGLDIHALQPTSYQVDNQATVTAVHNLGRPVRVTIYDSNGYEIEADVQQLDQNSLQVNFSQPLTGTVVLQ